MEAKKHFFSGKKGSKACEYLVFHKAGPDLISRTPIGLLSSC